MRIDDVTCLILAGGASRRMGEDKAFIQVEGVRLLDYVYGKCQEIFREIIIVTNQPQQFTDYQTPVVADEIPGAGSLGGLYTGLMRASNYYSFCVACDMPFLKPEFIAYLIDKRLHNDIVIPKTKEGLEPLHALYSKRCIEPIKKCIERGDLKISSVLPEVQVYYCEEEEIKKIDPALISFINANTKKELFKIQKMLKGAPWAENQEAC
jgi:molybdopterin-guanine dinucleotide biosynthesis protein A